ncbi:MAG: MFS transporter [Gammaproteobacteria bacterium]|nr:MFS transporter [Gammaproteobacteria bacterium]MDH5650553.1 MFS transporter [Gammaproteobacteria bacterium]
MARRISRDPVVDRSLKHSVRDGAAYSVMAGIGESYLTPFALFLKASTAEIGFLTSVPALLASFAQLFSAWLGHRIGRRRGIILAGAFLQALVWLPLAILPLLFPEHDVLLLIVCVTFYYVLGNLIQPQWGSLMGDLVAEKRRGRYFAMRTRICSFTSFASLVGGGLILQYFDKSSQALTGYLILFAIAFVARLVSFYFLVRMHEPTGNVASIEVPVSSSWWQSLRGSQFARFSLFFTLMQFSVSIAGPFFSVYMLRDLNFSYVELMICLSATVLMQFVTLNRWGYLADRFGNRVILFTCGLLIPVVPLLWVFSVNFYYLIALQLFAGMVWAGFSLSASNFLYDLIATHKRATYMAIHNVFVGIGVFFGAILGGYLGMHLPKDYALFGMEIHWMTNLYGIFILSFALRLITVLWLLPYVKEARKVRPITVSQLIFRVGRFSSVSGLIFDIIANRKKQRVNS